VSDYIATCRAAEPCAGFAPPCTSAEHLRSVEQAHLNRWHGEEPPATDELCQQMFEQHADESEVIIRAIETCAQMHGGVVDLNELRVLIPPGITPQLRGSVVNVLRARGQLVRIDKNVNDDKASRNAGKEQWRYRLVDPATQTTISGAA